MIGWFSKLARSENRPRPIAQLGLRFPRCCAEFAIDIARLRQSRSRIKIKVNNVEHEVDVDGDIPLLWVLRDVLGMTGTKFGCGRALCGACTVHLNGMPLRSCVMPVASVGESTVTTIEAIGETPIGQSLQKA